MMNLRKLIVLYFFSLMLFSCTSEEDICTSGEATPRLKMKFKTQATGKAKTLDSLFVLVDYGNGNYGTLTKAKVDSAIIPLRVDDSGFTEIYVKTSKNGPQSKLRFVYQTKNQFVSPACGMKKLYENFGASLLSTNPVQVVEVSENQIINENKTSLFLLF